MEILFHFSTIFLVSPILPAEVMYKLSLDEYQIASPRALFAGGATPGTTEQMFEMTLTKNESWCRASLAYVKVRFFFKVF